MKSVLTIIINYNNVEDTRECIQSCMNSGVSHHDIVLIDNGSKPQVRSVLKDEFPDIRHVIINENKGYSAGVNAGLKIAVNESFDFAFVLNNDIVINASTIPECVKVFQSAKDIGAVAPVNYFYDRDEICFSGGYFNDKTGNTPHYRDSVKEDRPVEFLTGAALMVRTDLLEQAGYFDEQYFLYHEDGDFCRRVQAAGYKLFVAAKATVRHKVSKTADQNPFIYYYCQRNCLYAYKTYGNKKYLLWFIADFTKAILRLAKRAFISGRTHTDRLNLKYSLWGIWDFFRGIRGKNEKI